MERRECSIRKLSAAIEDSGHDVSSAVAAVISLVEQIDMTRSGDTILGGAASALPVLPRHIISGCRSSH